MPIGLPIPAPLLRLGAGIIGTSSELLLKSRWVYPENLLESGFAFQYPNLEGALAALLGKDRKG
jgi:NAD dependent epimerase/dehydratase family enzyme